MCIFYNILLNVFVCFLFFRFRSSFTFVDGMSLHDLESVDIYSLEEYFKNQKNMNETVKALDHLEVLTPEYKKNQRNVTHDSKIDAITIVIRNITNIDHNIISDSLDFMERIVIMIIVLYVSIQFLQMGSVKLLNACSSCGKM